MSTLPLNLNVNLPALRSKLNHPVTLAYQRVAAGLAGAARIETNDLVLPGAMVRLGWVDNDKPTLDQIRADYGTWVLANGFRDAIEAVHLFLDQVRQVAAMMKIAGRDVVSFDEVDMLLNSDQKKFHWKRFPDKVQSLVDDWGIPISKTLQANVLSCNDARNCLVHRGGRVEQGDLKEDDALIVRWRRMTLTRTGAEGERELEFPGELGEDKLGLRLVPVERRFELGDRLVFSAVEFSELALSLTFLSDAVVRHLERCAEDAGLFESNSGA